MEKTHITSLTSTQSPSFLTADIFSNKYILGILLSTIFISSILSLYLKYFLECKKSTYSKLIRKICKAEAIFIFSSIWFVISPDIYKFFSQLTKDVVILDLSKIDEPKDILSKINISLFYAFQTYSILLNMFLCLEMILSIRYPVSKMQQRVKLYLLFAFIVSTVQFLFIIADKDIKHIVETTDNINNGTTAKTVTGKFFDNNLGVLVRLITLIPYIVFIFVGMLSILFLIGRFCRGKSVAKKLRNKFVLKHILYVTCYMITYLPIMINSSMFIIDPHSQLFYPDYSILIMMALPIVMFFVRGSEANMFNCTCVSKDASKKKSAEEALINDEVDSKHSIGDSGQEISSGNSNGISDEKRATLISSSVIIIINII